jgi:hypothetical protein
MEGVMNIDHMDFEQIGYTFKAGGDAIKFFRVRIDSLPKAKKAEGLARIADVERALKLSEAKFAQSLGYKLCRCTFPPEIMTWIEREQADVCLNEQCGRKHSVRPVPIDEGSIVRARRGIRR